MKAGKMKKWAALSMTSLMAVSMLAGCGGDGGSGEKRTRKQHPGRQRLLCGPVIPPLLP
ncbi:MAG: hypothetical protein ACLRMZ_12060 [Blautia marasmi]